MWLAGVVPTAAHHQSKVMHTQFIGGIKLCITAYPTGYISRVLFGLFLSRVIRTSIARYVTAIGKGVVLTMMRGYALFDLSRRQFRRIIEGNYHEN